MNANLQDRNAANLGDIVKHAALVALARLFTDRSEPFAWLDTHAYRLVATRNGSQVTAWRSETEARAARYTGYAEYRDREIPDMLSRSEYLCSSGLVLQIAGRLARPVLAESHPETRRSLSAELEAWGHTDALLLDDVRNLGTLDVTDRAGPLLALVDPLPANVADWPRIWTDEAVGGWFSALHAIEQLHAPGRPGAVLLYQWRRGTEHVAWPLPPRGFTPAGTHVVCQKGGRPCSHHLAVFATADMLTKVRETLASLGWDALAHGNGCMDRPRGALMPIDSTPRTCFDRLLAADYSGQWSAEGQRKHIVLSERLAATGVRTPAQSGMTREELRRELLRRLEMATKAGERILFAVDHQYAWPIRLQAAFGVDGLPWREALRALRQGATPKGLPGLEHPNSFCNKVNEKLEQDVFFSLGRLYSLPGEPSEGFGDLFRSTERALQGVGHEPFPANRIGDNGAVGGQTICGMREISLLLEEAEGAGIRLAVWPFDGLSLNDASYEGAHVCVEIYPTLLRPAGVRQTDENDATASADYMYEREREGTLGEVMDLRALRADEARLVRSEGWIFGVRPAGPTPRGSPGRPQRAPQRDEANEKAESLTPTAEQRAVIDCEAPIVRVIARAGTGKTTTMVERAARVLATTPDSEVAMLTFTRKAADELTSRFTERHGTAARQRFEANTFHGFALRRLLGSGATVDLGGELRYPLRDLRMLNEFGRKVALDYFARVERPDLELSDRWEDDLSKALNVRDPAQTRPFDLLLGQRTKEGKDLCVAWRGLLSLYAREGLLDFDVVMVVFEYLLRSDPEFRASARGGLTHWVADELQDTNYPQLRSLQHLAGYGAPEETRATQVVAVGDDFQTIYEWRGAVPEIFEKLVEWSRETCETLPLRISFRSCGAVVAVVNLRARALAREPAHEALSRRVEPELLVGRPTLTGKAWVAPDDQGLASLVRELREKTGGWRKISVLAYKNESTTEAVEEIEAAGIPADLVTAAPGKVPGVERCLALLSAWLLPSGRDLPLWWYFAQSADGIRPEGFRAIWRRSQGLTRLEARQTLSQLMGPLLGPLFLDWCRRDPTKGLDGFVEDFARLDQSIERDRIACNRVVQAMMASEQWAEDPLRLIGEMTRKDFAGDPSTNADRVQVSTIHQYKGLENDAVVLVYDFSPDEKPCLDYVGLSRAKRWLVARNTSIALRTDVLRRDWESAAPPQEAAISPSREITMKPVKVGHQWIDPSTGDVVEAPATPPSAGLRPAPPPGPTVPRATTPAAEPARNSSPPLEPGPTRKRFYWKDGTRVVPQSSTDSVLAGCPHAAIARMLTGLAAVGCRVENYGAVQRAGNFDNVMQTFAPLGAIQRWCRQQGVMDLSALIVGQKTNEPGKGHYGPECKDVGEWRDYLRAARAAR